MKTFPGYLIVFLGAGIGGSLRHAVNRAMAPFSSSFPWGTFTINLAGSFALGLIAGWFAFRLDGGQHVLTTSTTGQHFRLFLTTGLLGGFTTFSTFSLEAALLFERGRLGATVGYAAGSALLSIAALLFGLALMRP